MSSVQARKDEILAKKARLAELKRQREIRQKEFSSTRQSIGDASEVIIHLTNMWPYPMLKNCYCHS